MPLQAKQIRATPDLTTQNHDRIEWFSIAYGNEAERLKPMPGMVKVQVNGTTKSYRATEQINLQPGMEDTKMLSYIRLGTAYKAIIHVSIKILRSVQF